MAADVVLPGLCWELRVEALYDRGPLTTNFES